MEANSSPPAALAELPPDDAAYPWWRVSIVGPWALNMELEMRSAWTVSDWGRFARRHYGPDATVVARVRPEPEPAMLAESDELKGFFEEKTGILECAGLPKPEAEAEAARLAATLARNCSCSWASVRAALSGYPVLLAQLPDRPGPVDALPLDTAKVAVLKGRRVVQDRGKEVTLSGLIKRRRLRKMGGVNWRNSMARIRLRIELNKGRIGVPMDKFSQISVELGQFLIVLGNAVGVPHEKNRWLARDFAGGSSYFTTELAAVADVEHRSRFNRTIKDIDALQYGMLSTPNRVVPQEVLTQYAKMTAPLDIDETIGLGTFETDEQVEPNWLHFTRRNAIEVIESINSSAIYYGSILGSIHLLNKGSTPPYFQIRDIVTADLVKCLYSPEHYSEVVRLLEKREALVYIYGEITVSLAAKKIEQVQADRFDLAPEFTHQDFQKFFGCAPNLTGKLTTGQYMSKIRNDARSG